MDVISEIKKFESLPDRANFSSLQVSDFYKTIANRPVTFEAMVSEVHSGSESSYEIRAATYSYSISRNPVTERDEINWKTDMVMICDADRKNFDFDTISDLTKGDRLLCSGIFTGREERGYRVRLDAFKRIAYLEKEAERKALEERFNTEFQARKVFVQQRRFQARYINKAVTFGLIGAFVGFCFGIVGAAIDTLAFSDVSFLDYAIKGAAIGTVVLGVWGILSAMVGRSVR